MACLQDKRLYSLELGQRTVDEITEPRMNVALQESSIVDRSSPFFQSKLTIDLFYTIDACNSTVTDWIIYHGDSPSN